MVSKFRKYLFSFGGEDRELDQLLATPEKIASKFRKLPIPKQSKLILNLSKHIQEKILTDLGDDELVALLNALDPNDATDLLQLIDESRKSTMLARLSSAQKESVQYLLRFNPETAAGMMDIEYISVDKRTTIEQLSQLMKDHETRKGKFPPIIVTSEGKLVGEFPGYVLGITKKKEKVGMHVRAVPSINHAKESADIIELFKITSSNKAVVVDDANTVLGLIYSDDVFKLLQKQTAQELYDSAGVSEEEDIHDSAFTKVRSRYRWLVLNLFTAFLAAFVVGLFENTLTSLVLLAAYMPVVAGMGGNAGTQTMAVVVRGLALKELGFSTAKRAILNEIFAGAMNGAIIGAIVMLISIIWNNSPLLGVVVAISTIANLMISGLFGALVPIIMKRLGKDPATSATIFITTATDIFGFFIFLGLATILLV